MKAEEKLQALLKRQLQIKSALQAEREKRKAVTEKEQERLIGIAGRAVLANAAQSPEFREFLRGILRTTALLESEERFLKSKAWL